MKKYLTLFIVFFFPISAFAVNLITGGTETCNSTFAANTCDLTVDANTGTNWVTNNTLPAVWTYDFGIGNSETINEIELWTEDGNTSLDDFTIEGSNNNVDWDVLSTESKPEHSTNEVFPYENCTAYRWYRINATSNWRGGDNYTGFSEIEGNNDTPSTCGGGGSATSTYNALATASTTAILTNLVFGQTIMLVVLSIGLTAYVWNSFVRKKSWQK